MADDFALIITTGHGIEEAPTRFENIRRRGEAVARQERGSDAVLRGAAGVQRFGHRAEILAQTGSHARRDPERAQQRLLLETEYFTHRRRRPQTAHGRSRMKAGLIMARMDRISDAALDLDTQNIS